MHRILWCAVAVLASSPALAQDADTEGVVDGRLYKYKPRTEIIFEDNIEVTGQLVRPSLGLVIEHHNKGFNPLIRLRHDWRQEMADSVDEIR